MPSTVIDACPLCGLCFGNRLLLEFYVREDHAQKPERLAVPPAPAGQPARPPRDYPESDAAAE
jgi:hypothetical protein